MEQRLKTLFDYQKFKGDAGLAQMITETEARYAKELGDDEIAIVSAAGDPFAEKDEDDNGQ